MNLIQLEQLGFSSTELWKCAKFKLRFSCTATSLTVQLQVHTITILNSFFIFTTLFLPTNSLQKCPILPTNAIFVVYYYISSIPIYIKNSLKSSSRPNLEPWSQCKLVLKLPVREVMSLPGSRLHGPPGIQFAGCTMYNVQCTLKYPSNCFQ